MKTSWLNVARAFSIAFVTAAVPACGAGDLDGFSADQDDAFSAEELAEEDAMDLGSLEQPLQNCTTPDGTNAVMAAFAVSVGQELGRWQSRTDFEVYMSSGASETSPGNTPTIKLMSGTGADGKPRGKSRCSDGKCAKVQALLDMQYSPARDKVWIQAESSTNKVLVDPGALRTRMVAKMTNDQRTCDNNARDNSASSCPVETHKLTFAGTASLGGCGVHYKFNVTKDATGTLLYPAQLKWKLNFADQTNGWVDFKNLGNGQVAIDPTWGLNEDGTTSSGSCTTACTKVSTSNIAGQCCSCSGVNKKFVKSTFNASVYLCQ